MRSFPQFFLELFWRISANGEIGRAFSRTSGWKSAVPVPEKKRFHPRGTRASALDRGGACLGGVIELGLSKYVFCDHFGFVYALALEECDRVVAARTIGSAPPATSSSLPASISASSPFPPPRARPSARTQLLMPWPTMLERSRAHAMHRSSEF